jgi:hypothetical protein
MSVLSNTLGQNSGYINFAYEDSYQEIYTAVLNFVLDNHGWALHDEISTTDNVLVSDNEQPKDKKYVRLALDVGTIGVLSLKVYESWDNVNTHTGTNECYRDEVDLNVANLNNVQAGAVYLFATKDYMVIHYREQGTMENYGDWIGCIGFKPFFNKYDAFPHFGFATSGSLVGSTFTNGCTVLSSQGINGNWTGSASHSNSGLSTANYLKHVTVKGYRNFSVPRTVLNKLGQEALYQNKIGITGGHENEITGKNSQWAHFSTYSYNNKVRHRHLVNGVDVYDHASNHYQKSTMWMSQLEYGLYHQLPTEMDKHSGNPKAYTLWLREMDLAEPAKSIDYRGRLHGVKMITANTGVFGDVISLSVDEELLLVPDSEGTQHEHIVVPFGGTARYALPL